MLEIRELCAGYAERRVLRGVTLTVKPGELCALLGENGSGKSTLLRAVCALTPLDGGQACLGGRSLPDMDVRARAKAAAYLPQRSRIDEGMTALEAVLMGANARTPLFGGYAASEKSGARRCLERAGAAALEDRLIGSLSQGQRQMVLLARALMQRPELFLLDEPDNALDLTRRYHALHVLRGALGTERCALCALHDPALALSACDRVFILQDGRITHALDMHAAAQEEIAAAMRALYGDVELVRTARGYALTGPVTPTLQPDALAL